MKKIAFALLLGAAFVAGCGDKGGDGKDSKSASAASSGEAKKDDKGGGGGEIGVKECDDYMAQFKKCIDKVPAEGKAAMQQAYDQSVNAWKEAAKSGPEAKAALQPGCKAALDALAQNPMCK